MDAREAAALLHCGWAVKELPAEVWILAEPKDGYLHWSKATAEDIETLEAALVAHPALATVHQAITEERRRLLPAQIGPSPQAP